jgi:DNA-binding XRE family transcriptional regulator
MRSSASQRRAADQSARLGGEIRLARSVAALSTEQAAERAGVSWSTFLRIENGDPNAEVGTLCAAMEAVGLDLVLRAYPGRPPSLRDTGQLALAEGLCARVHPSLKPTIELAIGQHGEAIDTVLFGPLEIVAAEIERLIVDFQDQYRRADRKREALAAQHSRPVRLLMVVEDARRNRAAVERHLAFIRTVMPAGSREVFSALRAGTPLGRDGLVWVRRSSRSIEATSREGSLGCDSRGGSRVTTRRVRAGVPLPHVSSRCTAETQRKQRFG